VVSEAFKDLLKGWARSQDLQFVPQYEIETKSKERRYVDGALLYELRMPFGYWEAKDEKDDLDAEIEHKFKRGYPQDNILFEDSREVVLIQNREEVMRCGTDDVAALEKLLGLFFAYERIEIAQFRKAVELFRTDLPAVLEALRAMIEKAHTNNAGFRRAAQQFLTHAQETINPSVTVADVREMLIQHILTEEIFAAVFPGTPFHRDNNVARELYRLEDTFFTGNTKFGTLKGLEPYYAAIRSAAARIDSHHEKQTFLKIIYENFYKVYNVKAADRLGVVYTPNEIVRFMIESADWLCEKHFGKNLIDKNVEILDPATGTGTFISEMLEHFRGQPAKLKHKYREELHANEVAILPYYVANLNIEATYAALAGEYEEFPNLCFVDTLDNVGLHTAQHGTTGSLFGSVTEENVKRIKRQNSRKISVVIGNPPYNANQLNENENNKNREYPEVDERIKKTYIFESTAQKTKLYDMYARFFRWASDRVDVNGIVAFVSNSSFIDSRTFDGFRKVVAREFNEIWIVDLKGNARTSGERRRQESGNVFHDQIRVGIAVYFCVKKKGIKGCRIFYEAVRDYAKSDEKREFLISNAISKRRFEEIHPDGKGNWINLANTDFDTLLPILDPETKVASKPSREKAIFKLFGNGVNTARDEWVTDFSESTLDSKVHLFLAEYARHTPKAKHHDTVIKWSRNLKSKLDRGQKESFDRECVRTYAYRPYVAVYAYLSRLMIDELGQLEAFDTSDNVTINLPAGKDFRCLATTLPSDFHYIGDTKVLGMYRYDRSGRRVDNVTDWALERFKKHYQPGRAKPKRPIDKEAIFHYVYGVLHDPVYRGKYVLNLKREFPRIPFYSDFWQWSDWGKELMDLHISYESIAPAKLKRTDTRDEKAKKAVLAPKVVLKADKDAGRIVLDSETAISGIPSEAWEYKLGNRSALEWILDQYKESKPKDPTIREKFDTYRFADYKEEVINLLMRVTTVSVNTVAIIRAMKDTAR